MNEENQKHRCSTDLDWPEKGDEFSVNFLCNNLGILDGIPFQNWDVPIWPFSVAKHFHGRILAPNFKAP